MSSLSEDMPPTPDNVRKLLASLANDLKNLFRQGAIDARSGIAIEVDTTSGEIGVHGAAQNAPRIAALIGGQPDIERQIQNIAALGRRVFAAEQGSDARQAARVAQTAAQMRSLLADYGARSGDKNEAHDFSLIPDRRAETTTETIRAVAQYAAISGTSGAAANVSMVFNGTDLQIYANGKPWTSSAA